MKNATIILGLLLATYTVHGLTQSYRHAQLTKTNAQLVAETTRLAAEVQQLEECSDIIDSNPALSSLYEAQVAVEGVRVEWESNTEVCLVDSKTSKSIKCITINQTLASRLNACGMD